jgi:hypothetical protein
MGRDRDVVQCLYPVPLQLLNISTTTLALPPLFAFFGLHLHSRLLALIMGQSIVLAGASHAPAVLFPDRALEICNRTVLVLLGLTVHVCSLRWTVSPKNFEIEYSLPARHLEKVRGNSNGAWLLPQVHERRGPASDPQARVYKDIFDGPSEYIDPDDAACTMYTVAQRLQNTDLPRNSVLCMRRFPDMYTIFA